METDSKIKLLHTLEGTFAFPAQFSETILDLTPVSIISETDASTTLCRPCRPRLELLLEPRRQPSSHVLW